MHIKYLYHESCVRKIHGRICSVIVKLYGTDDDKVDSVLMVREFKAQFLYVDAHDIGCSQPPANWQYELDMFPYALPMQY